MQLEAQADDLKPPGQAAPSRASSMATAFKAFLESFYWKPHTLVFSDDTRCLENVLLSLFFNDLISLETFQALHDKQLNRSLWRLLKAMPKLERRPVLGDIVFTPNRIDGEPLLNWG